MKAPRAEREELKPAVHELMLPQQCYFGSISVAPRQERELPAFGLKPNASMLAPPVARNHSKHSYASNASLASFEGRSLQQLNNSVQSIYSTCYKSRKNEQNKRQTISQLAKDKSIVRASAMPRMIKLSQFHRSQASCSLGDAESVLSTHPEADAETTFDCRRGSFSGMEHAPSLNEYTASKIDGPSHQSTATQLRPRDMLEVKLQNQRIREILAKQGKPAGKKEMPSKRRRYGVGSKLRQDLQALKGNRRTASVINMEIVDDYPLKCWQLQRLD